MKKTRRLRLLALALAFTMAVPSTAYAAPGGWNNQRQNSRYQNNWYQNNWYQNSWLNSMKQTETTTETEMEVVESAETVENPEMLRAATYEVTTTETTTTSSLWGLTRETEQTADTTTVKYFPVTMYDYNDATIKAATKAVEKALNGGVTPSEWQGLYFSGGNPFPDTIAAGVDKSGFVNGAKYYIQNARAISTYGDKSEASKECWLKNNGAGAIVGALKEDATLWTLTANENGSFYLFDEVNKVYLSIPTEVEQLTSTPAELQLHAYTGGDTYLNGADITKCVVIQGTRYLGQTGSTTEYRGESTFTDSGNAMLFYRVDGENETLVSITNSPAKEIYYADWNSWDKHSADNNHDNSDSNNLNGDLIYTGLVQNEMINDQLVFNVPDGGIFNDDTTVKTVYEYVGLPFVLDSATGVYSFDSDKNGVYFADTDRDGSSNPQSGTAEQPYNLYFAKGAPQNMPSNLSVGDGSSNAWLPYNSQTNYNTSQVNYHFGMRADLPFSMTANGRVKSTDDESAPITFTFSGDDDVWVFVDGHLVIDLGGIHNRLDATIDFAANTITYSEENSQDGDNVTGSYNDTGFQTTQKLFTDADGKGIIDMSREVFAMDGDHEMQIFYLERGEGTSNCRIEFNLPMHDAVIVTKDATKSWSQAAEDADKKNDPDMEDPGVDSLTDTEQAIVNNIDFGFTLYKKNESETFDPVANTNYYLLDAERNVISIKSTDANGHFYLRNAQSAKFITEIPSDGVTYYVVEDKESKGFITPDFNFDGKAVGGFSYGDGSGNTTDVTQGNMIPEQIIPIPKEGEEAFNKSYEVTVRGSVESNDSVEFICTNYLDAELPNPSAIAKEDIIVIDYGLPVQIDPLANDVFRGDSCEIVYVGGADVTLSKSKDNDGVVQGSWTTDDVLESGTVELNDTTYAVSEDGTTTRDTLVYTLNKQLTEVEVLTYIVKATGKETHQATGNIMTQYDYAIGKIYIVPATTMYYEENFGGLVKFASGKGAWDPNTTVTDPNAVSAYQEPGVVGTVGDSTYGSDVAYLNDSADSNGTSHYGNTEDGPIRFAYTFTGTGTSFFARASKDTGYLQIKLYEGTTTSGSGYKKITYRDTYYKDKNSSTEDDAGTLYNIPVYTEADLDYGTYTVVVTVAQKGTPTEGNTAGSGGEFYLDGIRIMEPLYQVTKSDTEETVALVEKAHSAYEADGESNMDVVTLRYKLIADAEDEVTPWNFVVLTDVDGEIRTAEDYVSIGPKEEVYLNKGQKISFGVKYWHKDGYNLYMGMKAPMGTASAKSGSNTKSLANATDCYYDITGDYTSVITKDGQDADAPYYIAVYTIESTEGIVSLTNIKAVGNYEFVLMEDTDVDVNGSEGEGEE